MLKKLGKQIKRICLVSWQDTYVFFCISGSAIIICLLLQRIGKSDIHISAIFTLAVMLVSRMTNGYLYGGLATVLGVFAVNYAFTYPYYSFNFSLSGYPVSFITMFSVSLITCTMTSNIKMQEQMRMEVEREKIKATLLRAISHDLRTPLTAIIGATSTVLENKDELSDEKQRELLEEVVEESRWLIQMVENLLSITKINSEEMKIHKQEEVVEEVLSDAIHKFRVRYPKVKLVVNLPEEILIVPMDAMLIVQVLNNLLENAVIHAINYTKIEISVKEKGESVEFIVADDGNGIYPELLPHIFDEKYLNRTQHQRSDGTKSMGIGLSVCWSIIRAHGGEISASNRPEGGAEFKFTLPMGEETK